MSNNFAIYPMYLDTDTTVVANTNWRGSSGGLIQGAFTKGIIPTKIILTEAASGTAVVAGTVVVSDPQSSTELWSFTVQTAGAVTSLPLVFDLTWGSSLWRDFIVTGLGATKCALQVYYKY